LDLFSGKGSVGKCLEENGYQVVSLDVNPKFHPTHVTDILEWDYRKYPQGYFEVIAAGVPCTEYSLAKTIGGRDMQTADRLVEKTLEIVEYFQPR
jgi:site-specific DNA-cytosine methylase